MRKSATLIFLAFSLLLIQISGLHLHVCVGVEANTDHPRAHYADRGLFFGDEHEQDDSDDEEVDLPGASALASTLKAPSVVLDFSCVPFLAPPSVEVAPSIGVYEATCGPPQRIPVSAPHVLPLPRGPPAYS